MSLSECFGCASLDIFPLKVNKLVDRKLLCNFSSVSYLELSVTPVLLLLKLLILRVKSQQIESRL